MKVVAITGGIATGKSAAGRILKDLAPNVPFFDADASVGRLLCRSDVVLAISGVFGKGVVDGEGKVRREVLRDEVFAVEESRKRLEGILHPMVREECLEHLGKWRKKPESSLFIADIPLLFESAFDLGQDASVVVATSENTQRARLKARNHFDDNLISSILAAQLPIMKKVALADVVVWNEGGLEQLKHQLILFLKLMKSHE